jgi:hypothetical protein
MGVLQRACVLMLLLAGALPTSALAHVKWFVNYNLAVPPRAAWSVVTGAYFLWFCLVLVPMMFGVALIDRYLTRRECLLYRHASRLTEKISPYFPLMLSTGVSAFFAAVFVYGCLGQSMLLTPELHTQQEWVCWIQLMLSVLVLFRRTMFVTGAGIVFLYGLGIAEYGLFHMLDYPIFLGVAIFLILESVYRGTKRDLGHAVLRVCAGVTLLWASIEKFAFPEWSFMLMAQHPGMTLGLNPEFYMVAAGFVEFCAAYLLITGLLSARFAALGLLVLFVIAILPFGQIDAVGHSVIIVVLLMLALSNNAVAKRLDMVESPAAAATYHASAFFVTLMLFVIVYYGSYYLTYARAAQ